MRHIFNKKQLKKFCKSICDSLKKITGASPSIKNIIHFCKRSLRRSIWNKTERQMLSFIAKIKITKSNPYEFLDSDRPINERLFKYEKFKQDKLSVPDIIADQLVNDELKTKGLTSKSKKLKPRSVKRKHKFAITGQCCVKDEKTGELCPWPTTDRKPYCLNHLYLMNENIYTLWAEARMGLFDKPQKRKCTICKRGGHNAKNCPARKSLD